MGRSPRPPKAIEPAGYDPREQLWYQELMASPKRLAFNFPQKGRDGSMFVSIMAKTFDLAGRPLGLAKARAPFRGLGGRGF